MTMQPNTAAPTADSRLLAIDVSNLIIRHYSNPFHDDYDAAGNSIGGVCGTIRNVLTYVAQERPTHLILGRDGARSDNFRREIHPGYKAHRSDSEDEVKRQFELAFAAFDALEWHALAHPRHEADDVIASAAAQFPGTTTIISGDKDMLALCSPTTDVYLLRAGGQHVRLGPDGCREVMGVGPEQLRDYKALAGDKSDGIPGVDGVGAKSAVALLNAYGDLAGVYKALDAGQEIHGVRKNIVNKVSEHRDEARLSWRLAGMVQTIPMNWSSLRIPDNGIATPDDREAVFRELGLESMLRSEQPEPLDTTGMTNNEAIDAAFGQLF